MKLALSNIAWPRADDDRVAGLMESAGIGGLEIAPTALWPDPLRAAPAGVDAFRRRWADRGIAIAALQALLFGRPELVIFGGDDARAATLDHLTAMMDLAARLGARPMVFGSPKNRLAGTMAREVARGIAVGFFREAGRRAAERGVVLCLEPNPTAYGCDFINTTAEGLSLVREVDSPGFLLHLDAGALAMNAEPVDAAIASAAAVLCHFHASEPNLAPLGAGGADHAACAAALKGAGYAGWVSVEMRAPEDGAVLEDVIALLKARYG